MIQTKLKVKINPKLNPHWGENKRSVEALSSTAVTKAWRLRLILNRLTSTKEKTKHLSQPGPMPNPGTKTTKTTETIHIPQRRNQILFQVPKEITGDEHNGVHKYLVERTIRQVKNKIIIINSNTTPATQIEIQGMPSTMDINPESTWAKVKSIGRNNPFMFYIGGEDSISFDISWYSLQEDREDVITKCKLLKSWTRADGYSKSPPTLLIQWGNSGIFQDDTFVLTSAKYTLGNFQNSCREGGRAGRGTVEGEGIIDLKLFPNTATQSLVFERVTADNRLHEQIVSPSKVAATIGISTSQ